jgi:hypothetical protein
MFAVESVLFNGLMMASAARFLRSSPRSSPDDRVAQTIHARRLFFVSLAYLPLFFGCLLLHQRRRDPAELEAHDEAEIDARNWIREGVRERGRRLCPHEALESPHLCPVAAADGVVEAAAEAAAEAAEGLAPARQRSQV